MTTVALFGASGYGGIELARLLLDHPEFELTRLAGHSTAGKRVREIYPHLPELDEAVIAESDVDAALAEAEVLVFALHPGEGTPLVVKSVAAGKKTLDFSADFRLKSVAAYEAAYGPHPAPELVGQAPYGLPELHRAEIAASRFVAVPGCYPTSAALALAPAIAHGLVDPAGIIIDSMSGVSGAGRKLALGSHFSEVNESATAYKVACHRHTPEMEQELSSLGPEVKVTFTPHLIPITRGILTTAYATLAPGLGLDGVRAAYEAFYAAERCVRVLPDGVMPTTKQVSGTNRCDVGLAVDTRCGRLIAVAAIDNLIKGLAGAALQCMNLMCGYDELVSLPMRAMWP